MCTRYIYTRLIHFLKIFKIKTSYDLLHLKCYHGTQVDKTHFFIVKKVLLPKNTKRKVAMNKNFLILLSGQMVSQIGDKLYMLALAYLVLEKTQSPGMMGLVIFSSLFPSMVLGLVSGVFVDRMNKKWIIVFADLIRGLIVSMVGLALLYDQLNIPLIIASQVALSICSAFFDPAIPSIIPQLVKKDQLAQANSMTQFVSGFSSIIGPAIGGLAVAGLGYSVVLFINAGSYLISGFLEAFISMQAVSSSTKKTQSFKNDFLESFRFILSRSELLVVLLVVAMIHFLVGGMEVAFPLIAQDLEGNGVENLGYLKAAFGIGMVLLSLWIGLSQWLKTVEYHLFSSIGLVGLLLSSLALALIYDIRSIILYLLLFAVFGGLIAIASTCFRTILQNRVDEHLAGRVFGVVGAIGNISIPLAALIYGGLFSVFNYPTLLLASGLILSIFSILAFQKHPLHVAQAD